MPIKITRECRHCGQPVEQGADYFSRWFHSGRRDEPDSTKCHPLDPDSTLAIPRIDVVKRGES